MRRVMFCLVVLASACEPGPERSVRMTPEIVAERGVHTYSADKHRVFLATIGAFKTLGYDIAFSDETAGVVKTAPKLVDATAHSESTWGGGAETTYDRYTKLYAAQLAVVNGGTRVELTPRLFFNNTDVSEREIWSIAAESNVWRQLFLEIGSNLGPEPAAAPAEPAVPPPAS